MHGSETLYGGAYSDRALERWAERIDTRETRPKRVTKTRDVYCYFGNDMKVKSPFDARRLMARIEDRLGENRAD